MKRTNYKNSSYNGFAIPQVLLLGIGISVSLTGILYATILSLSGSKLNRQELMSKSSSESGITNIRNLLNDSGDSFFHYFWLSDSCSASATTCPIGINVGNISIPNPPMEYWSDEIWCEGASNCSGRQKAPLCSSATSSSNPEPINWANYKSIFSQLIDQSKDRVGNDLNNAKREFIQYFDIKSTDYTGTEKYGVNSIVVEGIVKNKNNGINTSFNKLRANIQVNNVTPYRGFGFLSAGEKELDGSNSLFLGNLNIISNGGNPEGSIIWRRNITDESECNEILEKANAQLSVLPNFGNGGLWVQPIGLPKQPRLKNIHDVQGALLCTPLNLQKLPTNCQLPNSSGASNYRIPSIYASTANSRFEVTTSDSKPITLEIMGDIDISNNGIFCHFEEGSRLCGSGNPKNLTILFKQETKSSGNKIYCNNQENTSGGVIMGVKKVIDLSIPTFNNDNLPGSSIFIDNTGWSSSERFGAFILGSKTTFISTWAKSPWVQYTESDLDNENIRAPIIVSHRGTYGWILDSSGGRDNRWHDKMTNIILTKDGYLIPYLNFIENETSLEIVGIGYDEEYQNYSESSEPKTGKFLIYNIDSDNYYLRSFEIKDNLNPSNKNSSLGFFPWAAAIMGNDLILLDNSANLDKGESKNLLDQYNIKLEPRADNRTKRFAGAAWVKNLCFDNVSSQTWEFDNQFINGIKSRYGNDFNFGIKFYRGRSIILWDTLRDFES